tara:strand:+ start:111 stop:566 length:456 start_codon:yes stop_codon:yes gene_type:complete
MSIFDDVLSTALGAASSSIGRVAGAALGGQLFGGGSSNKKAGVNIQIAAPNNESQVQTILEDDDLGKKAGLSASGFVKGTIDWRSVRAPDVQQQTAALADRGLERILASLIQSPPVSPDVRASLQATLVSPRSVSSNRQSKRFSKYIKGLT